MSWLDNGAYCKHSLALYVCFMYYTSCMLPRVNGVLGSSLTASGIV